MLWKNRRRAIEETGKKTEFIWLNEEKFIADDSRIKILEKLLDILKVYVIL